MSVYSFITQVSVILSFKIKFVSDGLKTKTLAFSGLPLQVNVGRRSLGNPTPLTLLLAPLEE